MSALQANILAERYAIALHGLAAQEGKVKDVVADVEKLTEMLAQSPELRRLMASPLAKREDRMKVFAALAEKYSLSNLALRFLNVMAGRRASILSAVLKAFENKVADSEGLVRVDVKAAAALTPAQKKSLEGALKKSTGRDVVLEVTVDPSLIGGLIVQIGSRMMDASLKGKLQRLQLAMKGNN